MSRVLCQRCERPLSVCICKGVESFASPLQVVILQTAREKRHAINSGRIVRLGVAGCQVFSGEDFSRQAELTSLLDLWHGRTWLLYPGDNAVTPAEMASRAGPYGEGLLVVLDATWRKSRRMLYLNPRLAVLPRVSLPETGQSWYRIRKVPGAGLSLHGGSGCILSGTGRSSAPRV